MNFWCLFRRDLRHFAWQFVALSATAALICAILTSALLIGSSVRGTLQDNLQQNTAFVKTLLRFPVPIQTPLPDGVLHTIAVVADSLKADLYAFPGEAGIQAREAYCSEGLADILALQLGDLFTVRVQSIAKIGSESLAGKPPELKQLQFIYRGQWPDKRANANFANPQLRACNLFVNHAFLAESLGVEQNAINEVWSPKEISEVHLPDAALWEMSQLYFDHWDGRPILKSQAFFLPSEIQEACPEAQQGLSIFVESFAVKKRKWHYFFAAAFEGDIFPVPENQLIVGSSMTVPANSSGTLTSFSIEQIRKITRQEHLFTTVSSGDDQKITAALTPEIPGLTDAVDCSRWEAGLPIDFSKINPARRKYWETYRSKPELYLNFAQAQRLLAPEKCTTLIFPAGSAIDQIQKKVLSWLRQDGKNWQHYAVTDILQQNIAEGVHFAPLFLGLSMFIIVSALLVLAMQLKLHLLARAAEFELFQQFTACQRKLGWFHLGELLAVILPGLSVGLWLGTAVCQLQLLLLEKVWSEILTLQGLSYYANAGDYLLAFAVSFTAAALVLGTALRAPVQQPRFYLTGSYAYKSILTLGGLSFLRRFREYRYCLILLLLGFLGTLGVGSFGIKLRGEDAFSHQYIAETVLPVVPEHNKPLPEGVLPVKVYQADSSDCSNLLLARTPTVYACDTAKLTGEKDFLPPFTAAVDIGSLKWIIKKKLGASIAYPQGAIKLARTLRASVFQRGILVDDKSFAVLFPETQGASLFLIPDQQNAEICREYLSPYGVTLLTVDEFMGQAENVQNRYLAIFLQLGVLGFILGIGSLLLLLLRNLLAQKNEIILLRENGFSQQMLFRLYYSENLCLYLSSALTALLILAGVALLAQLHLPTLLITWLLLCGIGCSLIALTLWLFFAHCQRRCL